MSPLVIVHEDDDLLVVDKPSGLAVHQGWAREADVLVARVRAAHGPGIHPVHRLDRGTSGLVVLARSAEAVRVLQAAFEGGLVQKEYVALVRGAPPDEALIDYAIPRREGGPRVEARTRYVALARTRLDESPLREPRYTAVLARPETGRLHQIRRHFAHVSHHVMGDSKHGRPDHNRLLRARVGLARLALHARGLSLPHPRTGARLVLHAPLPPDLAEPFARLGLALERLSADAPSPPEARAEAAPEGPATSSSS
jgi:tRNA pseudouridine65 synthase